MNTLKVADGTYVNTEYVRALFVDNDGPTAWYVTVQLSNIETMRVVEGFSDKTGAELAAQKLVHALGDVVTAEMVL